MLKAVQVQCPAKINLFLEVTGKRRDGYHKLATLFAKISLFDVIDAELVEEKGFSLEVVDESGQGLKSGPDNLVLKAAEAFRKEFKFRMGVRFVLTKRIPMGAGLGGGSSDAAGALIALARLLHMEQDRSYMSRIRKLAPKIGADVPFFLKREAFCDGRGIGEKLKPLVTGKALPWMILIFPGVSVSTPSVFKALSLPNSDSVLTSLSHLDKLKIKLEKGRPISEWRGLLFNRLEEPVLVSKPEVAQAKSILNRLGLQGVMMSGSGASVFGFVSSRKEGENALKRLRGYPWKIFLTCCLG